MHKRLLLFACFALSMLKANAAYVPITVTGYNADVVANGAGPATVSSPQDVDGANYAFMAPDYNPSGSIFPTRFLPATGLITSAVTTTPGLTYQLASYSGNNSLRLGSSASGTLTFTTPTAAGEVYVLATGGSGAVTTNITVTFTDASTQVFNSQSVGDWYGGANYAILGLGRVNKTNDGIDNNTNDPRLYQLKLTLLAANYTKQIASISFTNANASAGAFLNVMGISINDVCTGTPSGGTTTASASTVCATETLTLSSNGTNAVGISNQWQSSIDNGVTWVDITGGTTNPYSLTGQSVVTQYRNKISCTPSASPTVYSSVVSVATRPCYCSPSFTSGCSTWRLTNVTFGTINNSPSACATSNYTSMSTTVAAGVPFTSSISTNQYCAASVYIDLNNDGDFNDVDEFLYQEPYSGNATSTVTPNLTVPGYVLPGPYRIRFVCKWGGAPGAGEACTAFPATSYGNFHDYTVNVTNAASCYPPASLTVGTITATGATFTWTAPPTTTPLGYQWRIIAGTGPVTGTPVASGSMASGTLTVSPNTLSPATNYTFYVRSGCGPTSADSSLWNPVNFTTICGGAPAAGTATSSVAVVCNGVNFNLSATGSSVANGITYQWQSSPNGLAPWTAITGATTVTSTTSQTGTTSYRLKVTCNNTDSSFSNIVTVTADAITSCYCTPTYSSGGAGDGIANVVLGTLSNNSGTTNNSPYYQNFTSQQPTPIAIPNLMQGSSYPLAITFGSDGNQYNGVWIDFNQNGIFEAAEYFTSGTNAGGGGTATVTIAIPAAATVGITRMRIRGGDDSQPTSGQACGASSSAWGEAEDYLVRIISNSPCVAPTTQPSALVLTPAVTSVAGSFTASTPAANGYLILRTPGTATPTVAPVNATAYTVGATLGNATIVSTGSNAVTFTDNNAAPSTQYRYTVYGYNDLCSAGPAYNTTTPLSNTVTTNGVSIYTWTGNTSSDWQIAGNWTPFRIAPDVTDVLQFNDGLVDSVTNIPTQTVGRIAVFNNTTAKFRGQTGATRTLTLTSDNNTVTNELDIAAGSSLISTSTANILAIKFGGTGSTSKIAGTLEVNNTAVLNTIDFTGAIDTVTATGILAAGGTFAGNAYTSNATNLAIMGTYQHKYTTIGGGNVPTATWGPASNVLISGYTTSTGGPAGGLGQTFNNFTYNAPAQTANSQWGGTIPTSITGTLSVVSTGTGQWLWSNTTAYTATVNNYTQTAGTVDFGAGASGTKIINIGGTLTQSAGWMKVGGTSAVTFNFNNASTVQNVTFADSSISGAAIYRVSSPGGINLMGTGLLATTPVFKINNGGGVQISVITANPVNTTLTLNYGATSSSLIYDGNNNQAITAAIWPATNGPANFTVNNSGTAPASQVTLPGNRTVSNTLTITNGLLVLGSNNLTVSNNATGAVSISTPSATKMIVADGTGQLIRAIGTTAASTYLFPVGDMTGTAEYSPASITYATNAAARNVGIRVTNAHHPSDASANYLNRYWSFTDDNNAAAYTYNGNFTYTTADIVGTEASLRLSTWNGTAWTQIPSLPASNVLTIQSTQSSAFIPFSTTQVTGRTVAASNTYTWNGSVSTDYQVAGNWTPARNAPDPGDILQFNNAIVDTVRNIPNQTITRLAFTNNTTGYFSVSSGATLTFLSDNVTTTDELSIGAGSSIIINGSAVLNMAFTGTGGTANIAGTLDVVNIGNTVNPSINFTNAIATVAATGMIASGSATTSGANNYVSTAANLIINGTYNHKFTVNSGGGIPTATYNTGSTVLISGYTTSTGGPNGGLGQTFSNFTYNCPNQTSANNNWSGPNPLNITGTLSVISTGAGTWQYTNTTAYALNVGSYTQTGGIFDLSSGNTTNSQVMTITGNFSKTGGTFRGTNTTGQPTLKFAGTTVQTVAFDASPTGRILYWVTNPAGINLNGSGGLTAFNINDGGGVRISTTAAAPINTTLALTYAATGTTLTYDPAGATVATAAVWPATSGPLNVVINTGGSANSIGLPFNRTISGTLTMTSGDIDLGANTLTLGTAAATPGTLTYTAGNIRVTTGTFTRFFNTTGLPTSAGTGIGFYPIASSTGANRNVSIFFNVAAPLTTGGSIAVGHTAANGTTPVAVTDGAYNITQRTNAAWNFTTTGIVLSGTNTLGLSLNGSALFTSSAPANLRVMQPAAVVGTHAAGSGVTAFRTGMTIANLTSPYHIGANATDMSGAYIAINTGNWSTPATWLNNQVPGVANDAFINSGVTVTSDAATNTAKSLTVLPGANMILTNAAGTLTIDSVLVNNGLVNVGGGTLVVNGGATNLTGNNGSSGITNNAGGQFNVVSGTATLGPVNGSLRAFNNNGTLLVAGGTLNVNGSIQLNANSTFNQFGGTINVDGNAGGNPANSVPTGTKIVNILTPNVNLQSGTFTIVDPHVGASTNTMEYNVNAHANAGGNHTFRFGNGTSLDTGFNASYGFSVHTNINSSGRFAFKNVIVNSGTAANSWLVLGAGSTGVLGDFTVNTGGEYRQGGTGSIVYIAGNLVNNGTYSALGTTYFGNFASGAIASSLAAQSVTGTGTFRNVLTAPTGKFYKIQVNNNYNVTFNIGDVPFSNNVTFTASTAPAPVGPSRIVMSGTSALIELGGAGPTGNSAANGWVVGRYQKTAGSTGGFNGNFPIGDLNNYTLFNIGSATVTTTGGIWASTTTLDHPNIGTSNITGVRSVNRYFTVSPTGGAVFAANATGTFNWSAADVDAGSNTAAFIVGRYASSAWTYPTVASPGATSIQATTLDLNTSADYQVGEACSPINITTQPANVSACLGSPATLSVGLTGTSNVTYQWQKGTTNIPGANGPTYTIAATAAGDAGTYRVIIGSGCSSITSVTSATATLTINTPAAIATQPAATQDVCEGSSATMTVTATGTGVTYQWKKGGTDIPGATSATYTIPAVTASDAANYTVVVNGTAPCGFVTSSVSVLTVKPLPLTITAAGPLTFCPGGSVVLNAPVTTPTNTLTYQWRNGTTNIPGATGTSYTATASGNYNAVITNSANGCSNSSNVLAIATAGAPQATITPSGTAAFCQGGSIKLRGLNTPGLTYEWSLGTSVIPGATDSTYTATAPGSYTLKVSIGTGCFTVSTPTVVSVNPLPAITTTPTGPQAICVGDTLTINANFTGANLVWNLNGSPVVPAATGASYKATGPGNYTVTATSIATGCSNTSATVTVTQNALPTVNVVSSGPLAFCQGGRDTLKARPTTGLTYEWRLNGSPVAPLVTDSNLVVTQSGSYTVVVTNANGCKRTSAATVITVNPLPNVIVTPSLPLSMCAGQTNNLCVPTGAGQTYQWMNASGNIPGATTACYAATTAGTYSVLVNNTVTGCTATSVANTIIVNANPTATITNTGGSGACVGDSVCLNANSGTGFTYQWKINGGNIPGATNQTYCAKTTGNYTVVVTNPSNCSVTSSILTLTFNPRPTANISYTTPITFCEGGAVVLTGVSDIGTTYQWQNNGAAIPGATNNNFIASSTGSYSVIITGANGCSTVSPTILVVSNPIPAPVITRNNGILSTGSYASYQWYFNSSAIPGATNQSHLVTQNGAYAVSVTDFNNCTNYSAVYFFNNVGVPQLNPASIKVFPNPVHSVVNIQAPAQVNVVLRDLTGRMVMKLDNAKQLDMSKLADGTYMLMISDKNGNMVKMDKVLKVSDQ